MTSAIETLAAFTVGTVIEVSPNSLVVKLDQTAPQATALNTGTPMGFPRINASVLIPIEGGAVVGTVSRISASRQPLPKSDLRDAVIDLPRALRIVELTPVGTLIVGADGVGDAGFRLMRGVPVLPSVGDPVLLPSREQARSIIEGHDTDRRVAIGTAPFGGNACVTIDPDKLFGRHLAILGHTVSAKSCSVAGIIRWCLEAAHAELPVGNANGPNARFIILDPNGEYGSAFEGDGLNARTFAVGGHSADAALTVPGWLWNSQEWAAFTNAQPGSQRPLLMKALRMLRNATPSVENTKAQVGQRIRGYLLRYRSLLDNFPQSVCGFPRCRDFGEGLVGLAEGLASDQNKLPAEPTIEHELKAALTSAETVIRQVSAKRVWTSATSTGFNDPQQLDLEEIIQALMTLLENFQDATAVNDVSEDAPVPFDVAALPGQVEEVARASGGNALTNVEPLINRIQVMLGDERMQPIITSSAGLNLLDWLNEFVGEDAAANGQIAVIDLSLVPSDVVHVAVSVIARLIFDAVQRYKKSHPSRSPLPTTIVLEEAHNFIRQDGEQGVSAPAAETCRQTFERIAREGRKFGLGLLLSSQRPSELSPTVLAQCNTFLLHRLVNDLDQRLVRKLVPDALGGMLDELPTLPSQQAILLGWATPLPVLVRMRDLPKAQRPQSDDPDFWDVWTGKEPRPIAWQPIVDAWEKPGTFGAAESG